MITKVTSVEQLKQQFIQLLINNTDKVTKVSDFSVLSGMAYGHGKLSQKCLHSVAIVESHLFPDYAHGEYLDTIAANRGISPRFGASVSSTYIKLVADPGTQYVQGSHVFSGSGGKSFSLEQSITIGSHGFGFAKIRSIDVGESSNVDALSLNTITNPPAGHLYAINEFAALGGRDVESDELFRRRIKEGGSVSSVGTLNYLTQALQQANSLVLKVLHQGLTSDGRVRLAVVTVNGSELLPSEIATLSNHCEQFLSLTDIRPYFSQQAGVEIVNVQWTPIDIDFRVKLTTGANPDQVRRDIQVGAARYMDVRFWLTKNKVEWDDLLDIVKSTKGVEYVPDSHFTPSKDIVITNDKLPRFRSFIMRDLQGDVLLDVSGVLNPIFYPRRDNISLQSTVLSQIN